MKFGIFDHVDQSDRPLARQLDERLEFVAAADAAGYYCYHVAEHHATPLNMVPVPGAYLGAVARATARIRIGPLVYLLPLYSPLRLIEEICMLDHLSHGRLDVGVGRGVSPFELNYHKVDPETSRDVFIEALKVVTNGLTHERLSHAGKNFSYADVPMALQPLQRPYPPVWYGSSSAVGSKWAGENGLNFVTLGAVEPAKACIDAYRDALAQRGEPAIANPDFPGGTAIGITRHVVIAESDAKAIDIARPAHAHWYANLTKLERENVDGPKFTGAIIGDMDAAMEKGSVIAGAPETVRNNVARQIEELGVNYMILGMFFGTLSQEHAMRTMRLFADEVMAKL